MASSTTRSIDLSALVALPTDHPLHEVGDTARAVLRRESDRYTSAAATAAVLSIGERTLRRCWALMHYAKKSANHGQPAIQGQVLGTIEKSAIQGNPARGKPGKPVIVGRAARKTAIAKNSRKARKLAKRS